MENRAERVLNQVQMLCSKNSYDDLIEKIGLLEKKATITKQGKYIKSILDELYSTQGEDICEKIMRPCGYDCISHSLIKKAKDMYKESNYDLEAFLSMLNSNRIGGGNLHIENGSIISVYEKCYCGIPKAVKDMPKAYCECSAGWFEKLFSSVFEKSVNVERVQTILSGSDKCTFKINY